MTPAELRRLAELARKKGAMHAVALWPDEADAIAAALESSPPWISVEAKLPDADMLVLAALNDGETWPAFLDGDTWRFADATPIEKVTVLHWMDIPAAPSEEEVEVCKR